MVPITLSRIRIISFTVILISLLIIGKLFFVQIIHGTAYADAADRQYVTPASDVFERGNIFFTSKDSELISAATLKSGFKMAIVAKNITDPESAFSALNAIVPIDHAQFIAKASKKSDPYEEIALKLSKEQADAISTLHLSGVNIFKQNWRFYPGETLASPVIGFVGYKGDDFSGRYGLERYYNDVLSRTKENLDINFFAEVFSNITNTFFESDTKEGDVVTSIEPTIQNFLDEKLQGVLDAYHSDSIGGIIMNPKTGEIYAMSHLPDFNLNDFSQVTDPLIFGNPNVENVYEMGSVIKPLAMAAALDAGVVTPQTTYNDKGFVFVDNKKINNFDFKGRGVTTMQEVLNQSLNTGMVFVAQKLGNARVRDYMLSYGIGQKTGIDLPNEIPGLVSNLKSNRDVEFATAAFGQGITITPIETIRAFSALANGGMMPVPHIVKSIQYKDGGSKMFEYPLTPTMISSKASDTITQMLITVFDKALQGGKFTMDHYSVAAKTGTAQIHDPVHGGYYDDRHLHSFFGYFPAHNPQFIIFMYTVNPKGVKYAAYSLSDPFVATVKFLIDYYNITPDR